MDGNEAVVFSGEASIARSKGIDGGFHGEKGCRGVFGKESWAQLSVVGGVTGS